MDKKRLKQGVWVMPVSFFLLSASLGLASIVMPDQKVSKSERRQLRQFPELNLSSVLDGSFGSQFEAYALDQEAGRDMLLDIRSLAARYIFGNQDDGGIISWQGSLIQLDQEEKGSVQHALRIFDAIDTKYLHDTQCRIYVSVIPDKAFFVQDSRYVQQDTDQLISAVRSGMPYATYIDIFPSLSLEDYYHTDSHWRQENLLDTAQILAGKMGVHLHSDQYTVNTASEDFHGVYSGQTAWPAGKDSLHYLYGPWMDDIEVYSYARGENIPLYDLNTAQMLDPYDLYMGGNTGLLRIDNPHGEKNRELVVFRDSFGSSIIPLLAEGYSTVYVADIRQMPYSQLGRYIDFDHQDILFLYSVSVLNHASVLK